MKRLGLTAVVVVAVCSVWFMLAKPVNAVIKSGNTANIGAQETINDDVFMAGDTVTVAGTINGDLFVAGSHVIISGVVNGDVYAAGETIEITGTVTDDVLVASNTASFVRAVIGDGIRAGHGRYSWMSQRKLKVA